MNMFLGPEQFDWIYKDNPVIIPSKGKGTTDCKFVTQQHKQRFIQSLIKR